MRGVRGWGRGGADKRRNPKTAETGWESGRAATVKGRKECGRD